MILADGAVSYNDSPLTNTRAPERQVYSCVLYGKRADWESFQGHSKLLRQAIAGLRKYTDQSHVEPDWSTLTGPLAVQHLFLWPENLVPEGESGLRSMPGPGKTLQQWDHVVLRTTVIGVPVPDQTGLPPAHSPAGDIAAMPAVLGWSNGPGAESFQLYGLDNGPSPRWDGEHGRVVEQSLREHSIGTEGDRFLVIRLGSRFLTDTQLADAAQVAVDALDAHDRT